jgi:hypothetical protein
LSRTYMPYFAIARRMIFCHSGADSASIWDGLP